MTSTKPTMTLASRLRRVPRKWHDTTLYTAVVVTIILILQIWWMTKGHG